jgi:hypothetical protein
MLPLPRHLGATFGTFLLVAWLPSDVRLTMPTAGADAVSARSRGERSAHSPGSATAIATPSAATAASTAATSSTHTFTSSTLSFDSRLRGAGHLWMSCLSRHRW